MMDGDNPWGIRQSQELQDRRESYKEPTFTSIDSVNAIGTPVSMPQKPWEDAPRSTYPPPGPNPFNSSRSALRKPETPVKVHNTRLTPQAELDARPSNPLSSPGLDGPLTNVWQPKADLVLGVAVVDFNHLVGPSVEWSYPPSLTEALDNDEEFLRLMPFLALPDGAHLSEEDYSYFHCVHKPNLGYKDQDLPNAFPSNQTIFGISCNRQIAASDLLIKGEDVTRSTVQKAVVVLASRPVFGPLRDKLGVVTRAFFAQRDFSQKELLSLFYDSLEIGLKGKENESSMYIGTSLRELLHKFRHRTLTIVKLLLLQKRIMIFGYPVERLCTTAYSIISLMPGLLLNLADAGDPALDFRSESTTRPTSLRTSDRNSLLRYMGLPLHTFGTDAFFQPYLPLQQIDLLSAKSWLVGTTNSIVTQQRDCQWDLLINIDNNTFEFHDKEIERLVSLTSSDRAWMDQVVKSVEETWNPADPTRPIGSSFRGSDDDLRSKFEEYICSALSTLKYAEFLATGQMPVPIPGGLPVNVSAPFSEKWLEAVRQTRACQAWDKSTDELLFDICEPKHPCEGQANPISDIGIRLTEGLHDLHIPDQLGPTREAIGSALASGSSSLFKAFDGVRSEVTNRLKERDRHSSTTGTDIFDVSGPPSTTTTSPATSLPDVRATIGGIGTFFGSKLASWQQNKPITTVKNTGLRPLSLAASVKKTTNSADKGPNEPFNKTNLGEGT